MKVLTINCQGVLNKKAELETLVDSTGADIIIGCESWLNSDVKSNEVFPTGYNVFRKDRSSGKSRGGVFILVNNKFNVDEPENLRTRPECELLWVRVKAQGEKNLYIGSFYKTPDISDPEYLQDLESSLGLIPSGAHIWLAGDFNLSDIDWDSESTKPYAHHSRLCKQLLDITSNFFLHQVVDFPTRCTEDTSNTLDLFFTNNNT